MVGGIFVVKMKSETQIAQSNIDEHEEMNENSSQTPFNEVEKINERMETHKSSCERFLEFLEDLVNKSRVSFPLTEDINNFDNKITDLKQSIKLYSENGI